jgi:hypothetical protein
VAKAGCAYRSRVRVCLKGRRWSSPSTALAGADGFYSRSRTTEEPSIRAPVFSIDAEPVAAPGGSAAPGASSRGRAAAPAALALAALSALLALIAFASRNAPAAGPGGRVPSSALATPFSVLAGIAVSAGALVFVLIVAALYPLPRRREEEERESTLPALKARWALPLAAAVLALVFGLFVAVGEFGARAHRVVPGLRGGVGAGGIRRIGGAQAAGGAATIQALPAAIAAAALLALVGLATAMAAARRRLRSEPESQPASAAGELAGAIERSLRDLRAGGDARLGVIRCYVRMERALAGAGVERGPAEAPREYLARVQSALGGTEAARRLTALFEEARFSAHRIGEPMRAAALEALEQLRAELGEQLRAELGVRREVRT